MVVIAITPGFFYLTLSNFLYSLCKCMCMHVGIYECAYLYAPLSHSSYSLSSSSSIILILIYHLVHKMYDYNVLHTVCNELHTVSFC